MFTINFKFHVSLIKLVKDVELVRIQIIFVVFKIHELINANKGQGQCKKY